MHRFILWWAWWWSRFSGSTIVAVWTKSSGCWWRLTRCFHIQLVSMVLTLILHAFRLSRGSGWGLAGRWCLAAKLEDNYYQHSCNSSSSNQGDQQCHDDSHSNCTKQKNVLKVKPWLASYMARSGFYCIRFLLYAEKSLADINTLWTSLWSF